MPYTGHPFSERNMKILYMKYLVYLWLGIFLLLAFSCKKESLLVPNPPQVVKLEIKGYVVTDTLEFVLNEKVIGTAFSNTFRFDNSDHLYKVGSEIAIRKKGDSKILSTIKAKNSPFTQVTKIFYDGSTVSDKLELTPVTNPGNMGMRLSFSTTFKDFYGGPVDIDIFHSVFDWNTFETTYIPVKKVLNATKAFGDFFELSSLPPSDDLQIHAYVLKVYKAGTTELPYTKFDNVQISNPDYNYGSLPFKQGTSQLIILSPTLYDEIYVGDGYSSINVADAFQ
jgi:hypothetical protein